MNSKYGYFSKEQAEECGTIKCEMEDGTVKEVSLVSEGDEFLGEFKDFVYVGKVKNKISQI